MDIKGYSNAAYGIGLAGKNTKGIKNIGKDNALPGRTGRARSAGASSVSSAKFADFLAAASSGTAASAASLSAASPAAQQDRLEVDYDALFEQVKARIASAVDADTNLQRIQQLQSGYSGGSVPVSAGAVVSSIL